MIFAQLIVATLPVAIFLWIARREAVCPIVGPRFFRAMLTGAAFVPLIFVVFAVLKLHFDLATIPGILGESFVRMSVPEESLRFITLIYLARRRAYITTPYDFIIFSVAVGMGFALCENLIFVFFKGGIIIGVARAFTSIPSHYFCSVIMGALLALSSIDTQHRRRYSFCAIVIPIFLHGVYDTLSSVATLNADYVFPVTLLFVSLLLIEWQLARRTRRAVLSACLGD